MNEIDARGKISKPDRDLALAWNERYSLVALGNLRPPDLGRAASGVRPGLPHGAA